MVASNGHLGHPSAPSIDEMIAMRPPPRFSGGKVVDLQHVMITRLSSELQAMQECAKDLLINSHGNLSAQARIHEAVLVVLGAYDLAGLNDVIIGRLPKLLGVNIALLAMEPGAKVRPAFLPLLRDGQVLNTLGEKEVVLRQASDFPTKIFGTKSKLAKSYALAKLEPGNGIPCGFLALGACAEEDFHPDDNTDLIAFLARVIEDCLRRWWPSA